MKKLKNYLKAWEDLPIDRLYFAHSRQGYRSRVSAMLGWKVFRTSEQVEFCGTVLNKGTWCVQQDFINGVGQGGTTCSVNLKWSDIRKQFKVFKNK